MELEQLVDQARESTLFTAPVAGTDLSRFLAETGPQIVDLARRAVTEQVEHIYWAAARSMVLPTSSA
jgi:hypothetical protein